MQRHLDAKSFSGAVTLVARNGRIGHFEAHGLMDIESRKPMQKDAMFRIMSMTKPIVGVSILMLIEEGKVRLTDPVSKLIPELQGHDGGGAAGRARGWPRLRAAAGGPPPAPRFYAVPAEREITVRDLLTHTSGLGSGTISNYTRRAVALQGKESLADFIPRLGKTVLEFQPGTRWAYSAQDGFDVLARVVEIASGMGFDQFAKQRIFDPLGMKDTFFYPPSGNPRMATLYSRHGRRAAQAGRPELHERRLLLGRRRAVQHARGLPAVRADAGQRRAAEWQAAAGATDRRDDGSMPRPTRCPGRPKGESYGLSVRVVNDPMARNTWLSEGSFGWSGAFGTHFWVDRKENLVAVVMTQTSNQEFLRDFENMVMQAVVGNGTAGGTN